MNAVDRVVESLVRRSHLDHSHAERAVFLVGAAVLFLGALTGVASVAGFGPTFSAWGSLRPQWLFLAFGAQVIAYLGYMLAYREVAKVDEGPGMPAKDVAALVATGFGPFVAQGGFAVDLHAFRLAGVSDREARVRVLGLGALEYALLAPTACLAAIFLIFSGVDKPGLGLTLPWAIAVPVGFLVAFWAGERRQRFHGSRGWREGLAQALDSVYVLRLLFTRQHLAAPLGSALYWFGDILCLWSCLRAFEPGVPEIAQLVVGYATGYALTRRTLPFAGAGAVEALLPFALLWTGFPLADALAGVFFYRLFNLWLPILPAALGLRWLQRPQ